MANWRRGFTRFIGVSAWLWLSGCATPAQYFDATARQLGFSGGLITGNFQHRWYFKASPQPAADGVLHVYLDGDGTPWQRRGASQDPTPRQPLILELMTQDPRPALLLGRPCYYGLHDTPNCAPHWWTTGRYHRRVVASMTQALQQWLTRQPFKRVVLIGYSGGGSLAVLIAPHVPQVAAVLTVAANLDVQRWSDWHGYLPLTDSLNPMQQTPLAGRVQQWHVAGGKDDVVPPAIVEAFVKTQAKAHYWLIDDADHVCCWLEHWSAILARTRISP